MDWLHSWGTEQILAKVVIPRNESGSRVKIRDVLTSRPAPSTEFRRGSCCHSHIGGRHYICKVLSACVITHSKTPLQYTCHGELETGAEVGRGRVGMGGDGVGDGRGDGQWGVGMTFVAGTGG